MGTVSAIFEHQRLPGHAAPMLAFARVPGIKARRCAIVLRSREGACVSSSIELPDYFILRAVGERIERLCRVVWRDDQLVGVEYVNARTMGRARPKTPPFDELLNVVALAMAEKTDELSA